MFSKPAIRMYTFLALWSAFFCFSSLARAADVTPWGIDFEKQGTHTFTLTCDGGKTVSKIYQGTIKKDNVVTSYKGQTTSMDGVGVKRVFYLFAHYTGDGVDVSAGLREGSSTLRSLSQREHIEMMMALSPNLYAQFMQQKNDCVGTALK